MFSRPNLPPGETACIDTTALPTILAELDLGPDTELSLASMADYAIQHWTKESAQGEIAEAKHLLRDHALYEPFKAIGLTEPITAPTSQYSAGVIDGGSKPVIERRLAYTNALLQDGLQLDSLTFFSGQRLRAPYDDRSTSLESIAHEIEPELNTWGRQWIKEQLMKCDAHNPWERSFATEHEIAILALLQRYGRRATHEATIRRPNAKSVADTIPPATVHSEVFDVGGQTMVVLNGQAVIRVFINKVLPANLARPTGESCFDEWTQTQVDPKNASILLLSHNPSTYRTWLDMLAKRKMLGLEGRLDAAGAGIEDDRTVGYMLGCFGRLLISLHRSAELHAIRTKDISQRAPSNPPTSQQ